MWYDFDPRPLIVVVAIVAILLGIGAEHLIGWLFSHLIWR